MKRSFILAGLCGPLLVALVLYQNFSPTSLALGHMEDVRNSGEIQGWAASGALPGGPLLVEFYIDGAVNTPSALRMGEVMTANHRPDVELEHGFGAKSGFRFEIPEIFRNGKARSIYAYVIDPKTKKPIHLSGSPKTLTIHAEKVDQPLNNPVALEERKKSVAEAAQLQKLIDQKVGDSIQRDLLVARKLLAINFISSSVLAENCARLKEAEPTLQSGIYRVYPSQDRDQPERVFCLALNGGMATHQIRDDGSVNGLSRAAITAMAMQMLLEEDN